MSKRIMIIGSFSGGNFGDNMILLSAISILKKSLGGETRFIIPTSNPDFVNCLLGSNTVKAIDINIKRTLSFRFLSFSLIRELRHLDAIVTTAGIFFDQKLWNPRFNFVSSLLPLLYLAKTRKIKIIGLGTGASMHTSKLGEYFLKHTIKKHDIIIARDVFSYEYKRSFNPNVILKYDIAHSVFKEKAFISHEKKHCIGINISSYLKGTYSGDKSVISIDAWTDNFAEFITELQKKHTVKFFATTKKDYALNQVIVDKLNENVANINLYDCNTNNLIEYFSDIKINIGSRLHFCVLSISLLIPTIALSYHTKVNEYMASLGMENLICPIEQIDLAKLRVMIKYIIQNEANIKSSLQDSTSKINKDVNSLYPLIIKILSD